MFKIYLKTPRRLILKRFKTTQTQTINSLEKNSIDKFKSKLFEFMSIYEEAIGIKEIKQAQQNVLDAEKNFLLAQNERRSLNLELIETQQKLRNLRDEMDRLNRTDSKYLKLFTEEHSLLQTESRLVDEYKLKENQERDLFFYLSSSLRDSQEAERVRIERMKYLQLGLSILCTSLGILSAYLLNYFRNSNIKEILAYDKQEFSNLKQLINNLNDKQVEIELVLNNKIDNLNINNKQSMTDLVSNQIKSESNEVSLSKFKNDEFIQIHPYVISALILIGYILYVNK